MVNKVVLVGRLANDLEIRSTKSGKELCNFRIAVNRNFKNQNGEYDADFINCISYEKTAQFMSMYIQKGQLISVTGRIQTRNYENNMGQRVYITEIVCDNVNSLEKLDNNQQNNSYQDNYQQNNYSQPMSTNIGDDIDDSELPF